MQYMLHYTHAIMQLLNAHLHSNTFKTSPTVYRITFLLPRMDIMLFLGQVCMRTEGEIILLLILYSLVRYQLTEF